MHKLLFLTLFFYVNISFAVTSIHKNEQSGLLTYTSEDNGFSVEFIQLLPDFIRAIYSNHQYPKKEVEDIASYCVFGSIIKNTSDKTLTYNITDWHYLYEGKTRSIKTKSQWIDQWRKAGIIFSWTLLPDTGTFYVGDWQQGFLTIKSPRDSHFDLIYTWQLDGRPHQGIIKNMQCPPADINL